MSCSCCLCCSCLRCSYLSSSYLSCSCCLCSSYLCLSFSNWAVHALHQVFLNFSVTSSFLRSISIFFIGMQRFIWSFQVNRLLLCVQIFQLLSGSISKKFRSLWACPHFNRVTIFQFLMSLLFSLSTLWYSSSKSRFLVSADSLFEPSTSMVSESYFSCSCTFHVEIFVKTVYLT